MVPQICFLTFLGHFCRFPLQKIKKLKMEILSFYTHVPQMTTISYLWCMASEKWSATDITCCHFGPFYAPVLHYNSNFKNNEKKTPRHIILLYLCITNDNHMMYGSWDMGHDRQNFLPFCNIFCLFTLLTTQKTKIL